MTETTQNNCQKIDHDMGKLDYEDKYGQKKGSMMATFAHQSAIFSWVIGPMFVYYLSEDSFAKRHALEAMNWQISIAIYTLASILITPFFISVLMLVLFTVINAVACVIGSIDAINGNNWTNPLSINIFN